MTPLLLLLGLLGPFAPSSDGSCPPEHDRLERQRFNLNAGWDYLEEPHAAYADLAGATNWQRVDLPHTWNQWDATDATAGYRRDASWYRKRVLVPTFAGGRYFLYFEGANLKTRAYVNGQPAGQHTGGYVGFRFDVTDLLRPGAENEIAIRVDNGYDPNLIPSQKSDFFIYGGITRDLWLEVLPANHLARAHVSTPAVSRETARTRVQCTVRAADDRTDYRVTARVLAPDSDEVLATAAAAVVAGSVSLDLPEIARPRLWSPEAPHLHRLVVTLFQGTTAVDERTETFGYRWYDFEPNGAFRLNGERLLIRGTHRHEEHAGYGAAMPNRLHRRDMEMIKEMGANFVRLGHYPQDPEVYRACDELGIIVWDELPWCRGGKGGPEWEANTERLLTEQIRQNYNHPSVFFWSLGNELYWLPDFPGGDDPTALNAYLARLNGLSHRLDPYRMTALRKYYDGADIVDVFSPSIWSGWYAGVYSNYAAALAESRTKYPHFLHMEYGGSSHVGRHTETPITGEGTVNADDWAEAVSQIDVANVARSGDWTENYIVDLFDWHLRVSETTDWFAGNAQWAFKDFGTPLRPENAIPYLNQKGLTDRDGQPKDAYYVYKSYWGKEPFAYIESHTWTERTGPAGKAREVCVYSNAAAVEFWHEGRSLGRRTRDITQFPASGLHWPVDFREGDNELIAVAYGEGDGATVVARDTLHVNYAYVRATRPDRIELTARPYANGNYLVEATMVDAAGRRVLDYEGRVYFDRNGAGRLLENYGTPTRSRVLEMANGRAAIELVPAPGRTVIEARNQDFKGSYLVLEFDGQSFLLTPRDGSR